MESNAFSVAWSVAVRKLFLFGGTQGRGYRAIEHFNAYSYSTADGWKDLTLEMKGHIPAPRKDACLVPAYGGTKMVLFGGFTSDRVKLVSDIIMLDVATMTWTKGRDPAKDERRGAAACAVSNDHFVSWGGTYGNELSYVTLNSTIVYDIKTNKWTSTFIPGPKITTTRNIPLTDDSGSSSGNSSRIIDIISVVLGVVVAALAVCALLLYQGVRAQKNIQDLSRYSPHEVHFGAAQLSQHPHELIMDKGDHNDSVPAIWTISKLENPNHLDEIR
ncbi:hypothetical protein BGZ65_004152 [Modicella reniformis]|uniref:Uncharacterized protein n=1 Tax=Modicella reniformis TaxID=1440133 RepID=A0A9P6MI66_9FUNG|nr:hypothetical protein BGZ65_004152 [Modicella reniformis]